MINIIIRRHCSSD